MAEWKENILGKVCTKIGSGSTPTGGQENYKSEGISLVRSQNILDFSFSYDGLAYIDEEQAKQLNNVILQEKDILINITGDSVARVCQVPIDILPARVNQHVSIIRPDGKNADSSYVLYLLISLKEHLLSISEIGATRRAITKAMLENLDIKIPSLPEQRAIAEILSSLDDKIDLLNRQNKTLEDLAQTYFRQWFVEKKNRGWKEKGLDEIAEFLNGLALQNYPYTAGEPLKVIKIREMNNGFSENTDICSSNIDEKYIVNNGDVIFSWSGSLSVCLWKYGKGALNQHLFKVFSKEFPKWFYYFWIKHYMNDFLNIAEDKATTMGHIQRHHLSDAKVLIPDDFNNMNHIMIPLIEKEILNNKQIESLRQLRDTLLPKLVSGEVRVKEV